MIKTLDDNLICYLKSLNLIAPFLIFFLSATIAHSQQRVHKQEFAAQVRSEFLHAWRGYKKYAWGHDDLRPLSKTHHDWYATSLLMTPVDALDTMVLMGLSTEAQDTKKYIIDNLSFDQDVYVQNFEVTIRLLGGLLSSYQITGDKRLLALAEDLGIRLLPAFDSPTGLPYRFVNLKTGRVRGSETNPAEAGTLLIEFGTLSKLTNKPVFYDKAKRSLVEIYNRRSPIGLVGQRINVETGKWTNTDSHLSAEIDSYYEYLLKSWLLFDDGDCKQMWLDSIAAVNKYLADEVGPELWYGHADMLTGQRTATTFGALDAFFPAVLALSGDLERAKRLQLSSFKMWMKHGIAPEEINYKTMQVGDAGYHLRPEIVESTYYLYRLAAEQRRAEPFRRRAVPTRTGQKHRGKTAALPPQRRCAAGDTGLTRMQTRHLRPVLMGDADYLRMGKTLFRDFVRYCKTDEGYAALKSVVTKERSDSMQSFLFAETFKYFYLLFAPSRTLDFDNVIFNTEAHPIRRTW